MLNEMAELCVQLIVKVTHDGGEYKIKNSGLTLRSKLSLICNMSIFSSTYEHHDNLKISTSSRYFKLLRLISRHGSREDFSS